MTPRWSPSLPARQPRRQRRPSLGFDPLEERRLLAGPDNTPPVITLAADPSTLWPPNHKMIRVHVTGSVTDNGTDQSGLAPPVTYRILDEYAEVPPHDQIITVAPDGHFDFYVTLDASRHGDDLDGRQYLIRVNAQDNAGNAAQQTATVVVPHDRGASQDNQPQNLVVFQPTTSTFNIQGVGAVQFGQGTTFGGNPVPLFADLDGDGLDSLVVFQPSTSTFYIQGVGAVQFGQGTLFGGNPKPIIADFNGDGHDDLAVYQPSTSTFYIRNMGAIQFGQGTNFGGQPVPIVTDYNGDGRADLVVYQPTDSTFYIKDVGAIQFGQGTLFGGQPVPQIGDFNDDGQPDLVVFQPTTSTFYIRNFGAYQFGQGTLFGGNPQPFFQDIDSDGQSEITVYQPSTSTLYVRNQGGFQFGQGTLFGGRPILTQLPGRGLDDSEVGGLNDSGNTNNAAQQETGIGPGIWVGLSETALIAPPPTASTLSLSPSLVDTALAQFSRPRRDGVRP